MSVSRLSNISMIGVEHMEELAEFKPIPPHGGWSMLIDVSPFGLDGAGAAARLLERGRIAATPMVNWGSGSAANYLRIVFSNEPLSRLKGIGRRFRDGLL